MLTLNGPNGEYGGPVTVARELCSELNRKGHQTHIISGARKGSEPSEAKGLNESFVLVRSLSSKFPVSSLWSWKLLKGLLKEIRKADVVHIHFARDLIPVVAAIICIFKRKRFVLQTHGMISNQETKFHFWFDILISKRLLNMAEIVFCLSKTEIEKLNHFELTNAQILQNGVKIPVVSDFIRQDSKIKVIFLSRIEKRKNLRCYIDVAHLCQTFQLNYSFEIYGPDEGDLTENLELIEKLGLTNIRYCGSVRSDEVQAKFSEQDILILPSFAEPWAMTALEALSVGTRIIIFPSAGIAPFFQSSFPEFITDAENAFSVFQSLVRMDGQNSDEMRSKIKIFCSDHFSISAVTSNYLQMLNVIPNLSSK